MKNVLLALCCLCFIHVQAQDTLDVFATAVKTLDSTITNFYKSISTEKDSTRQWDKFKYLFKPDAKLIVTSKTKEDSLFRVRYMDVNNYIENSGEWMLENGFIEREINREVNQFGNIAHVFSTFEAYHSSEEAQPFMRGINSIQLLYDNRRWWIINVYWTLETKKQPIPKYYLPED